MAEQTDDEIVRSLIEIKQKSEDSFEKNITIVAGGTLILSLTFVEKIVSLNNAEALPCLIISWGLLALTILINLVSHQVSSHLHGKTVDDFRSKNQDTMRNVSRRNFRITIINYATSISLVMGIIFLIVFCSVNAYFARNQTKEVEPKYYIMPIENEPIRPQTIEPDQQKGMPINIPRNPIPSAPINPAVNNPQTNPPSQPQNPSK